MTWISSERHQVPGQHTFMHDLDDGCMTLILRQLAPLDVFSMAGTCRRYRDILQDGRLALVVSKHSSSSRRVHRHVYDTLQAAVADSRPGETILLEATEDGSPHEVADVVINWPLHIFGDGPSPADTVLQCAPGAAAALDFRCSGKVANVTVRAARAACVRHQRGSLWVQQCALECDGKGLDHLFSAIVTSAPGGVCGSFGTPLPLLPEDTKLLRPHRLTVVETAIQGGRSAIQTLGTGALQHVRCIFREAVYFWFDVDAAAAPAPGSDDVGAIAAAAPIDLTYHAGDSKLTVKVEPEAAPRPGFVAGAALGVKRKAEALPLDEAEAEALLDKRARLWSATHHLRV